MARYNVTMCQTGCGDTGKDHSAEIAALQAKDAELTAKDARQDADIAALQMKDTSQDAEIAAAKAAAAQASAEVADKQAPLQDCNGAPLTEGTRVPTCAQLDDKVREELAAATGELVDNGILEGSNLILRNSANREVSRVNLGSLIPAAKADRFLSAVTFNNETKTLRFVVSAAGEADTALEVSVSDLIPVATTGAMVGNGTTAQPLNVRPASATAAGVAELATATETKAGTDNTRVVTPAGLKATLDDVAGAATTNKAGMVKLGDRVLANDGATVLGRLVNV